MVIRNVAIALAIVLSVAGCSVTPWQRPAGHPADPSAPAGAPEAPGSSLDRYRKAVERGAPDAQKERTTANPDRIGRMLADELTVEEAVAIALVNNRELRAEVARADVARADLVQAGLLENPAFGLALRGGDGGGSGEVSFFAEFLNLFTLSARRNLASGDLERVRLEVAQSALELAAAVKRAYYALLAGRQALELSGQVLDTTEAAAELAFRQQAAGTLSRRDQALQQSFFARAALHAAQAEAEVAADREKLNRLLGLWGDRTTWQLPARLPDIPDTLPAATDLESLALARRIDLAARRVEVETAHTALGYARQTRWLSLFGLGFTLEREADGARRYGPDLTLSLPLFDRGQGRLPRLEAQLAEAEHRYAQLAVAVRSEVREAAARLAAAHAAAIHHRDAILPLAQRVVDETLKFYNGMLVGVYELLEARQAQVDAAREAIAAWRDFWVAWSEMERAQGTAIPDGLEAPPPDHTSHGKEG